MALGGQDIVLAEFHALLETNPVRARLCRQIMLAPYRTGRAVEALCTGHCGRR
ncbi:BTAD domain-containing putative transcriptional regulator [Actinophytocola sp.]|uniref:BTAD domain-containing putative transcriptional regulator n=1 Tax=Actinophytocola sp. TaxID=1872138 RepID=UPI0039C86540